MFEQTKSKNVNNKFYFRIQVLLPTLQGRGLNCFVVNDIYFSTGGNFSPLFFICHVKGLCCFLFVSLLLNLWYVHYVNLSKMNNERETFSFCSFITKNEFLATTFPSPLFVSRIAALAPFVVGVLT